MIVKMLKSGGNIQETYDWFSSVMLQDIASMNQKLKETPSLLDVLHPLRHTTALMEATRLGRNKAATWLVGQGAAPGLLCGVKQSTAFHMAIRMRNLELVETMLTPQQCVSVMDCQGRTLLHMLAQYANPAENTRWLVVAKELIARGIRLDTLDSEGITALHYAIIHDWAELAELLLEAGANPNALALDSGVSPVLMAALNQQRRMVRLLLDFGANPHLPASDGQTAAIIMPDITTMIEHIDSKIMLDSVGSCHTEKQMQ